MHSNQQDQAPQTPAGRKAPPPPPFRHPLPAIVFPEELPVSGRRDEIAAALQAHQVIIVSGETGSGKTTLASLVARLQDPTAGRVLIAGNL